MLIYQYKLCKPFNAIRIALMVTMCTIFAVELLFFKPFFTLARLDAGMYIITASLIIIALILWKAYNYLFDLLCRKSKRIHKILE